MQPISDQQAEHVIGGLRKDKATDLEAMPKGRDRWKGDLTVIHFLINISNVTASNGSTAIAGNQGNGLIGGFR